MDLYVHYQVSSGGKASSTKDAEIVEKQLWHVWDVLMGILKDHRMHYLECKSWLVNTLARQALPATVRLAALSPFMQFAAPPGPGAAEEQHRSRSRSKGHRSRSRSRSRSRGKGDGSRSRSRHRSQSRSRQSRSRSRGRSSGGRARSRSPHRRRSRSWDMSPARRARRARSRSRSNSRSRSPKAQGRRRAASRSRSPPPVPVATHMEQVTVEQQVQHQLLLLLMEERPTAVCELLATQLPHVFRSFFRASDLRILLWFSHFSVDGMAAFKYGAFALAHYCLAHRGEAWGHLVWEGKHPQAPVSVATKTHYFCEINVVASVRNLIEHCPGFWTSEQWVKCVVQGGEVLQLEPAYFAKALRGVLAGEEGPRLQAAARTLLHDFVAREGPWGPLAHRLLPLMDDDDLLKACLVLCSGTTSLEPARANSATHSHPSGSSRQSAGSSAPTTAATLAGPQGWRDLSGLVLSRGARWVSLPQLVLAHALVCGRGQLLAILREDEECGGAVEQLCAAAWALHAMPATTYSSQAHAALLASLRHPGTSSSSRQLLALDAWTLRLALATRTLGAHPTAVSAGPAAPAVLAEGVSHQGGGGGGGGSVSGADVLRATVERLGWRCSMSVVGGGAAGAGGCGGQGTGAREYSLLESDDDGEGGGKRGKRKRARSKHKRSKKGKGKHKRSKQKRKKHRHSSSSSLSSGSDSESVSSHSSAGSLLPLDTKAHEGAYEPEQPGAADTEHAQAPLPWSGLLRAASSQLQQFEIVLPATGAQQAKQDGGRDPGADMRLTGGAEDVADVLACYACKHWVQAVLQAHSHSAR